MKSHNVVTSANVVNVSFTKPGKALRIDMESRRMSGQHGPIDFAHLSRQSGGDEALEAELLSLFAEQCARQLVQMADSACTLVQRGHAAHTLKGAAKAVGAWAVAEAADEIEAAFDAGRDITLERMMATANAARETIRTYANRTLADKTSANVISAKTG